MAKASPRCSASLGEGPHSGETETRKSSLLKGTRCLRWLSEAEPQGAVRGTTRILAQTVPCWWGHRFCRIQEGWVALLLCIRSTHWFDFSAFRGVCLGYLITRLGICCRSLQSCGFFAGLECALGNTDNILCPLELGLFPTRNRKVAEVEFGISGAIFIQAVWTKGYASRYGLVWLTYLGYNGYRHDRFPTV